MKSGIPQDKPAFDLNTSGPAKAVAIESSAVDLKTHCAVGIANSGPLAMLSGQRCMTDFCLV